MARRDMRLVVAGLLLVALGAGGTWVSIRRVGQVPANVRPATAAEAPSPEHAAETVVADPGGSGATWLELRALGAWLLVCGLLVALGVGAVVWGSMGTRARRQVATEEAGHARG